MKRLTKYYSDGKIIDIFNGSDLDGNNEVIFIYDQVFEYPQVVVYDGLSEINQVNYAIEKLTGSSIIVKFQEKLPAKIYTIKIY